MLKCQDDLHREFKDFKGSITRQLIALQVLSIIAPPVTIPVETSHCFRSAWRRCSPCTHPAASGKAELIQIKECHLFGRNISSSLLIVTDGNGAGAANTLRLCDWVGFCRWRFKGCWLFMILERIQSPSTAKKTVHLHLEGCRQGLTLLKVII